MESAAPDPPGSAASRPLRALVESPSPPAAASLAAGGPVRKEHDADARLARSGRDPTPSSIVSHFCLMAKASKVSPTFNPNIAHDDDVDDNEDEYNHEESDNIASLKIKGDFIFISLYKNKLGCSNFMEIMSITIEGKKYIEELEAPLEDHGATIETMQGHGCDYADEVVELSQALENEQTTKESLEETFALEFSRLKESHDRALEHLENGSRAIKSSLIELIESHAQLEASYAKELAKLPSPLVVNNDARATNSISCEASILKENVELRAQLELLSSNTGNSKKVM
ncbi:hypothetical protein D1007_15230 [Hordeum vulgare]|nr:hypothetical protein D1007_15230 [Hordeum vulgare]